MSNWFNKLAKEGWLGTAPKVAVTAKKPGQWDDLGDPETFAPLGEALRRSTKPKKKDESSG